MPCGYVSIDALNHDPDLDAADRHTIETEMKEYYLENIRSFLRGVKSMYTFYREYNDALDKKWKHDPRFYHPILVYDYSVDAFISFAFTGFLAETVEQLYRMFNEDFDEMPTYINDKRPITRAAAVFRLKIGK